MIPNPLDNEIADLRAENEIFEKENIRLWAVLAQADKLIGVLERRALLSSGDLEIVVMIADYRKMNPMVKHV